MTSEIENIDINQPLDSLIQQDKQKQAREGASQAFRRRNRFGRFNRLNRFRNNGPRFRSGGFGFVKIYFLFKILKELEIEIFWCRKTIFKKTFSV
jgi:hypothetical protein